MLASRRGAVVASTGDLTHQGFSATSEFSVPYIHVMSSAHWVRTSTTPAIERALDHLAANVGASGLSEGDSESADVVIVWADRQLGDDQIRCIDRAWGRQAVVVLLGPTLGRAAGRWGEVSGLLVDVATAGHDVRVRPGTHASSQNITDHLHMGLGHLGEHVHCLDRVLQVDKIADDVEVLLQARIGLVEHPVAAWRPSTRTLSWTLGGTEQALGERWFVRQLILALRRALSLSTPPPVRVGLLGYGAIGHEHARAASAVDGLELAVVCDTSAQRRDAAAEFTPGVRTVGDAASLLDEDLDLVVVSTPPVSHAEWALRVVQSGRHVVVEKPFAITTAEADAVLDAASERGLLAVVYQNRRFDPDFLALRTLVHGGALGEVFHLEAFVGGYGHPCNLWHSDEGVSGGAFYDWGAHVIDQLLDLLPGEVASVSAATHKRRWLDVTNADHSRVTMQMSDGVEAEFVYSDLAAALKPRWYVLGTEGAVVGQWRTERIISRSSVGTLAEDVLSPADSPPVMDHHHGDGSVTRLALAGGATHPFHNELADQLRLGLPMSVTGAQSRRVLAVMEAARQSASEGGIGVQPR
jgi:scyllo-inositol 2-dehydrogenase (NADP+)